MARARSEPFPVVYRLSRSLFGVMISASHNPYQDNGIKIFGPDGYKLSDEQELAIEAMLDDPKSIALAGSDKIGRAKRIEDAQARYIEFAKRTYPKDMTLDGLRVVIDTANGTFGVRLHLPTPAHRIPAGLPCTVRFHTP